MRGQGPLRDFLDYVDLRRLKASPKRPALGWTRLFSKNADGDLYQLEHDGTETLLPNAAGASFTHAYLGYNTVGGTAAAMTAFRQYLKKITVSTAGILTAIEFYTKANANGATPTIAFGLWDDSAGSPVHLIAMGSKQSLLLERAGNVKDARWLGGPIGVYVPAADYWIGVQSSTTSFDIYNDASGTDHYLSGTTASYLTDVGSTFGVDNTTTNKYSIRASIIT